MLPNYTFALYRATLPYNMLSQEPILAGYVTDKLTLTLACNMKLASVGVSLCIACDMSC